jgi:hypothetical protein
MLQPSDEAVRGALTRLIARLGFAPDHAAIAAEARCPVDQIEPSLQRLGEARALLLHPNSTKPWIVHPFALAPASCFVETARHGYWASCLYCAFGVATAVNEDAVITTRFGCESETATFRIVGRELLDARGVFHFGTPFARWWDNVVFACSSFQPFRIESDVDRWCDRHGFSRGAVISMDRAFRFSRDWYGNYVAKPWRRRTPADVKAVFDVHGFTGPFWKVPGAE